MLDCGMKGSGRGQVGSEVDLHGAILTLELYVKDFSS